MIKIKMTAKDTLLGCKTCSVFAPLKHDSWYEQLEHFYEFLKGQGYIITYASFIDAFGDIVKEQAKICGEKCK